jgi:hypothetical protein
LSSRCPMSPEATKNSLSSAVQAELPQKVPWLEYIEASAATPAHLLRPLGPISQCGVAPRLSAPLRCGENLLEQATDGFWAGWMVALASDPVVETR